jgi:CheY-like chemotaxis protein
LSTYPRFPGDAGAILRKGASADERGSRLENEWSQKGLRVLVVEDEALIALLLEDMLIELGAIFVGPFANLAAAVAAAGQDDFDVALIDLNLGAERADDVAAVLAGRGIPFALASGEPDRAHSLGQTAVLQKPFTFDDIADALHRLNHARG